MEDRLLIYDQREIYYTKDDGSYCRCPICGINFRRDAMKIHFLIHVKSGLIHCRECDKQYYFQDERAASVHFEYHVSHLSYTCSLCGVSARFKEHIEDHLKSHHGITYYKCSFCKKNLHSYEEAKHHMYFQHHETRPDKTLIGTASSVPILHDQIVNNDLNKTVFPNRRAIQDLAYSPNKAVIGVKSSVPISHDQIVHNDLKKAFLPYIRPIQDLTCSPNETVIGAESSVPILHDQIVRNDLNKTVLPDRRAIQDITCSPNETVIGAESSVPISHDQIVHNYLKKAFLPNRRAIQDTTCSPNETVIEAESSVPILHDQVVHNDLNQTVLPDIRSFQDLTCSPNETVIGAEFSVPILHDQIVRNDLNKTVLPDIRSIQDLTCSPNETVIGAESSVPILHDQIVHNDLKAFLPYIRSIQDLAYSPNETVIGAESSVPILHDQIVHNDLKKAFLPYIRSIQNLAYSPNETVIGAESSVPILHDQIVRNDLNKTVLPDRRAIQDITCSPNETVIGAESSVPISHDQIVHNDLKKAFLPDKRAIQDTTCSPNETVIEAESSVPILHDQVVRNDLNQTVLPDIRSFQDLTCSPNETVIGAEFSVPILHDQIVRNDLNKTVLPDIRSIQDLTCSPNETVIGAESSVPILHDQIVHNDLNKTVLPDRRAIQDITCSPNETVIEAESSVPILHDQIVHNNLDKTVLPNIRPIQDLTCSPETVIWEVSSDPILHDQIVYKDLNKTFLPRKYSVKVIQQEKRHIEKIHTKEPFSFDSNAENSREKASHNEWLRPSSIDGKCPVQINLTTASDTDYSIQLSLVDSKLDVRQQSTNFCSNSNISCEVSSSGIQLDRHIPPTTDLIQVDDELIHKTDADSSGIFKITDIKSEFCWEDVDDFEEIVTWSQQEENNALTEDKKDVDDFEEIVTWSQQEENNALTEDKKDVDDFEEIVTWSQQEENNALTEDKKDVDDFEEIVTWSQQEENNALTEDKKDVDDFEEIVTWSQQEENNALTEDKKDVLDLDEEITLRDQWQMNGNPASGEIPFDFSVYLQHYSVNRSKVLECPVCEKMYNPNVLKEHFYTHDLKRLVCTKCKKTFANPSNFYYHYLSCHSSVKPFECSLCDRSFKMRCYILRHLRTDHGIRYTCPQCNLKFKYMKNHNVRQCISLKSKPVSSSIKETKKRKCLRKTTKKASLNSRQLRSSARRSLRTRPMTSNASHLDSHKEVTSENTELMEEVSSGDEDDDVTFSERGEMSKGSLIAAEVQPTRKQKDVANLVKAKNNLKKFRSLKNDNAAEGDESSVFPESHQLYSINSTKVLQCPLCEETFNANTLRKHYFAHTDRDLVCIMCEKVFACHWSLYEHYFGYHSSVKPFECSLCDKSFKTKGGILKHLKGISHTKVNLKVELSKDIKRCKIPRRKGNDIAVPFKTPSVYSDFLQHYSVNIENALKCPECQKRYNPHVLKKHFDTHVLEDLACTKCKKTFQTKNSLYNHYLNSHSSAKPFECSMCDQSFKLKRGILKHLRFDHGIQYKCPQCNLKYKSWKDHNVGKCSIKSKLNSLVLQKIKKNKSAKKNMKQLRLLASSYSTPSRSRQLRPSRKHSRRTTEMTSNGSHLDNLKEMTSEDTELVEFVSNGAKDDDASFHERAEMSTGRLMAAEVQPIRKRKDMLDMVEGKFNCNKSEKKMNGNIISYNKRNVYSNYLQHYSISTKKILKCPICEKMCKSHTIKKHIFSHGGKTTICIKCKLPCANRSHLYDHYMSAHNSAKCFECSLCDKSFKLKYIVFFHLRTVHGVKYKCPQCYLEFGSLNDHNERTCMQITQSENHSAKAMEITTNGSNLDNHMELTTEKTHLSEPIAAASRRITHDDKFQERGKVLTGRRKATEEQSQLILKDMFDMVEAESPGQKSDKGESHIPPSVYSEFLQHFTVNTKKDIECHCQERYKAHLFKEHFYTHADKDLVCAKCKKVFRDQSGLYYHYLSSHNSVKLFECSLCDRSFKLKEALFMHLMVDHDVKYKCHHCNLKFTSFMDHNVRRCSTLKSESKFQDIPVTEESTSMSRGIVMATKVQPIQQQKDMLEGKFNCNKSEKQMNGNIVSYNKRNVYSNYLQHYSISTKKKMKCPICEKMRKSHTIKKHMFSHVGKTTICIKCKLPCANRYSLYAHYMSAHNSAKPFECTLCDKSFKLKHLVFFHLRNAHGVKYKCPQCYLEFGSLNDHNERTCMQITQSENHSAKAMEITTNGSNLDNHMELTTEKTHLSEPIAAASRRITHDDKFQERGKVLTGRRKATEEQSQLILKDMFDMVEAEIDLNESPGQKSDKGESHIPPSVYSEFLQHFTVNTKKDIECHCQERYKAHLFKEHFYTHADKDLVCAKCKKVFRDQSSLYYHYLSSHNSVKLFECSLCDRSFKLKEALFMHLMVDHDVKYKCHHCNLKFTSFMDHNVRRCSTLKSESKFQDIPVTEESTSMSRGIVMATKVQPIQQQKDMLDMVQGKFNCNKSEKQMNGNIVSFNKCNVYSNYLQHYSISTKKKMKCPICEKMRKSHTIKKHIFSHVGKTTNCIKCKLPCANRYSLYAHYMSAHNSAKPFECTLCDKSFKLKHLVFSHLRTVHGVKYKCLQCNLEFGYLNDHNERTCMQIIQSENHTVKAMEMTTDGSNLDNHMELTTEKTHLSEPIAAASKRTMHDGKRQERGKVLTGRLKATKEQSQLISKDMLDMVQGKFNCNKSEKQMNGNIVSFNNRNVYSNYLQHYSISTKKKMKCPICEKMRKSHTIKKHIFSHVGKTTNCIKCKLPCANRYSLYAHYMSAHNSAKPFECTLCDKSFKLKHLVFSHLRTVHGVKYKCLQCNLEFGYLNDHNERTCMQIIQSENHTVKAMEMTTDGSNLDNHMELTTEKTHLSEPIAAASKRTMHDGKRQERGKVLTGRLKATKEQSQLISKDVLNLAETKINLNESRRHKKSNATPWDTGSVYSEFLKYYSIDTKKMLKGPICEKMHKPHRIKKHIFSHGRKQKFCQMCKITFKKWQHIYGHYLSVHNSAKPFECLLCESSFKFKYTILNHLRNDHGIKYRCPKCDLEFGSLKDHSIVACMQNTQSRSHSVKVMEITRNSSYLDNHKELTSKKTHLSEPISAASRRITHDDKFQERGKVLTGRLKATEEQSQLKSKDMLDMGEAKFNLNKPERQKNDNAALSKKPDVYSNYLQHYLVSTKKKVKCPICEKICKPHTIKKHIFSHVGKTTICIKCKLPCANRSTLYDHYMNTHNSVEPFECSICNETFKLRNHVFTHLRTVHGIKYKCRQCNLEFSSLKDHNARTCMQIIQSENHSVKAMETTRKDSNLDNHMELTTEKTHLSEPIAAASKRTMHDGKRQERGKVLTGRLKATKEQSQLISKDVLNLAETKINLNESRRHKKSNATPWETGSVYSEFLKYYSVDTKKMLKCPICEKMRKLHRIKKHIFSHDGKQRFCKMCKITFKNWCYLYDHYLSVHNSTKPFECLLCESSFKFKYTILNHLRNDHGIKYRCPKCDLEFGSLKDHSIVACMQNTQSRSHSVKVMEITRNSSYLDNHKELTSKKTHPSEPISAASRRITHDDKFQERGKVLTGRLKATEEQSQLKSKDMLDIGEAKFNLNKPERQKNDNAAPSKKPDVYSNYLQHYSVSTKKKVKCPICEKICKPHTIKKHIFSHVGKTTICIKCKLPCANRSTLYDHYMNTHNSVEPFECSICNETFKLRNHVFTHLRTVHGIKYKCRQCNLEFSSLKDHNARTCMQIIQSENHTVKAMEMTTNGSNLDNHMELTPEKTHLSEPIAAASKRTMHDGKRQERGKVLTGRLKATKEQSQLISKDVLNLAETKINLNESRRHKKSNATPWETGSVYSEFLKYYSVDTKKMLKCPICEKMRKLHRIKKHIFSHDGKQRFCKMCKITFKNWCYLYDHYLSVHNSAKPFECLLCESSFKFKYTILNHLRNDHGIKYRCPKCDLEFGSLKDHSIVACMQNTQSRSHSVKVMEITRNSSYLDNHKELTSKKTHLSEPISAASRRITHDDKFQERGKVLTGRLKATEEQSQLKSKDMLDIGEAKFNLNKPERQKNDNAALSKKPDVYSNYLQHYSVSTKKKVKCPICEKICKPHTIKKHIFSHVGKTTICIKCKWPCVNRSTLYGHYMNTHNSVKPFECSICNETFKLRNHVFTHLRTVHDIKYKCLQCNLEFSSLKDHNVRTCMQITQSGSHSVKAMEMTTNGSNLDNHKELTTEKTHLSEPIAAASKRTMHDGKRQERGKVLTGKLKATKEQSQQLISKDMLDMIEGKFNLSKSEKQKNGNILSFNKRNVYSNYLQHYSISTKNKMKCPICEKMCKFHTIKKHIFSHVGKTTICIKCKWPCASRSSLYEHYMSVHNSAKPFECSLCDKSFKLKGKVLRHLRNAHGVKYKCPQCYLEFGSLNDHNEKTCMQITQSESHSAKALEITTNGSNLDNHMELSEPIAAESRRITHDDKFQEREKVLTGRLKATEEQSQLKSKGLHEFEEQNICMDIPQENKNGTATSSDKNHSVYSNFVEHYCIENEKIGKCPVCSESQKFFTIRKHLQTQYDIGLICVKCFETFTNQHELNTHYVKYHCKVKPFKCLKCSKCFKMKTILLQHLRTEHYMKYKCSTCYQEYDSLNDHNVSNCNPLKLRIELVPSAQRKSKKHEYLIKNGPAIKEKKIKQYSRSYYENLENTVEHRIVSASQTVSSKIYKKKLKKAIRNARQRNSNRSGPVSKRLNTKKDKKQPESLSDIESKSIQFTSPESQEDEPSSGNQEDESSPESQNDETSSGSQEDEISSASQEDEPSSGSQENEPMQMITVDDHSKKQSEMTCAGISVNGLMQTFSGKTISDDNFLKEREISTGFLGTPDVQSKLPLRKKVYNKNDAEQLELLSLSTDITSKCFQVTPSTSRVKSIRNNSYKRRCMSISMKAPIVDNSPKFSQISTGILGTAVTQSQLPFINTEKRTEQSIQLTSSGSQEDEPLSGNQEDQSSPGSQKDEPSSGSQEDEPLSGIQEDESSSGSQEDESSSGSQEDESSSGIQEDEPLSRSQEHEPLSGSQKDEPLSGSQEDQSSPGSQKDEPLAGNQEDQSSPASQKDEPSSASQKDEPSSASQEVELSSRSQELEPSTGSQVDEPIKMITVDYHSKKQKEITCSKIRVNRLTLAVSGKTISNENFPKEREISTGFIGTPDVQSKLPLRKRVYNKHDAEQLELLRLPDDITTGFINTVKRTEQSELLSLSSVIVNRNVKNTSSDSQVNESIQIMSIKNHLNIQKEKTWTGIRMHKLKPAVSMETLDNNNFAKEGQMSTCFLGSADAQTHFPFPIINRMYTKKTTEKLELSDDIGSRNMKIASSENQVDEPLQTISIDNPFDKQREMLWTGIHENEPTPAVSMETFSDNNSPKGQHKSVGILGTPNAQSQLPLMNRLYTNKNTEQLELLHFQGYIGSQVDVPLEIISNDSYSYKQKEITWTGMHENEQMPAASMNTLSDDNSSGRGHGSTGFFEAADTQSQLTQKGVHSNMLDLVETQMNQNEPESQKNCTLAPSEDISAYYSKYYSFRTKTMQKCPICCEVCTPHTIKKHLQSHDGSDPVCIVCGKLYEKHHLLHDHYSTCHIYVKPFECLICDKFFELKECVLHHLRTIHDIRYEIPQCDKDLESKMNFCEQQREYKNIEYHVAKERPEILQETQEDTVSHKTGTNDTTSGDKSCNEKAVGISLPNRKEVSIPLESSSYCGVPISSRDREVKEQPAENLASNSKPISLSDSVLDKALIALDSNTDAYHMEELQNNLFYDNNTDAYHMEELQNNLFYDLDELTTDNLYPTDTLECLNSDSRLDMEKLTVQKSTRDAQYLGILGGCNEECVLALQEEDYFVSLWMSETDITDTSCNRK